MLARFAGRADAIADRPRLRRLILWTQVARPERVPPAAVARALRTAADAPGVAPLLRELPSLVLAPLPALRPYDVRVVWAEPDRVIPFRHFGAALVERIPGAELIRVPGIGHVPTYDDPEGVARLILEVTGRARHPAAAP